MMKTRNVKENGTQYGLIFCFCNCRNKDNCSFDGEFLSPNIIYRADITTDNDHKFYYGTSEASFKKRHNNHIRDFKHVGCY